MDDVYETTIKQCLKPYYFVSKIVVNIDDNETMTNRYHQLTQALSQLCKLIFFVIVGERMTTDKIL